MLPLTVGGCPSSVRFSLEMAGRIKARELGVIVFSYLGNWVFI